MLRVIKSERLWVFLANLPIKFGLFIGVAGLQYYRVLFRSKFFCSSLLFYCVHASGVLQHQERAIKRLVLLYFWGTLTVTKLSFPTTCFMEPYKTCFSLSCYASWYSQMICSSERTATRCRMISCRNVYVS